MLSSFQGTPTCWKSWVKRRQSRRTAFKASLSTGTPMRPTQAVSREVRSFKLSPSSIGMEVTTGSASACSHVDDSVSRPSLCIPCTAAAGTPSCCNLTESVATSDSLSAAAFSEASFFRSFGFSLMVIMTGRRFPVSSLAYA